MLCIRGMMNVDTAVVAPSSVYPSNTMQLHSPYTSHITMRQETRYTNSMRSPVMPGTHDAKQMIPANASRYLGNHTISNLDAI